MSKQSVLWVVEVDGGTNDRWSESFFARSEARGYAREIRKHFKATTRIVKYIREA